MKWLKEFRDFALRGNVMDLAVGVMIGGAFGKITTSLVNDVFMPLLSLITGKIDLSQRFLALDGNHYASLADAQAAQAATLNYGAFLTTIIDFALIALCVFFAVKLVNRLTRIGRKQAEEAPKAPARLCPYCFGELHPDAIRCPHCTSLLTGEDSGENAAL